VLRNLWEDADDFNTLTAKLHPKSGLGGIEVV
jgi:hypothetical protein